MGTAQGRIVTGVGEERGPASRRAGSLCPGELDAQHRDLVVDRVAGIALAAVDREGRLAAAGKNPGRLERLDGPAGGLEEVSAHLAGIAFDLPQPVAVEGVHAEQAVEDDGG